jgi:hypothetical protein
MARAHRDQTIGAAAVATCVETQTEFNDALPH